MWKVPLTVSKTSGDESAPSQQTNSGSYSRRLKPRMLGGRLATLTLAMMSQPFPWPMLCNPTLSPFRDPAFFPCFHFEGCYAMHILLQTTAGNGYL